MRKQQLTAAEADEFIMRCRRILPAWQREIDGAYGDTRAEAEAARDSVLETLREIAADFPDKSAKIGCLVDRFGRSRMDE